MHGDADKHAFWHGNFFFWTHLQFHFRCVCVQLHLHNTSLAKIWFLRVVHIPLSRFNLYANARQTTDTQEEAGRSMNVQKTGQWRWFAVGKRCVTWASLGVFSARRRQPRGMRRGDALSPAALNCCSFAQQ